MYRNFILLIIILSLGCNHNAKDSTLMIEEVINLQESGQHREAIEVCEKILDNEPDSSMEILCLNMIAFSYSRLEEYYDEISWGEKLTEKYPNLADGFSHIGSGFQGLEKYDLAMNNYLIAIKLDTNNAMLPFSMAMLEVARENLKSAIDLYKICIARDSLFSNAYYNIAVQSYNICDYKSAEEYCKLYMKLNPKDTQGQDLYKEIMAALH